MFANTLKYLFSALSAIYFIFAGTGYNIVQYCCDDCASEGIEFVAHHTCAMVHHEKSHDCCDMHDEMQIEDNHQDQYQSCSHADDCQIIRVQLNDFPVIEKMAIANILPENLFLYNSFKTYADYAISSRLLQSIYSPPDIPTPSGREILTNKSVLVI